MAPDGDKAPRKQPRDARRAQLIEATIEVLAAKGYARTTLTEVARAAGISHGLVNFHFRTKEQLLAETLRALWAEYQANWTQAFEDAPDDPAARLDALLRADFDPRLSSPARLAAWFSFWGESQGRPMYQELSGANDEGFNRALEGTVARLMREGGYAGEPCRVATVLRVVSDGVWLDMTMSTGPHDLADGLRTVFACAAAFFPRHFDEGGWVGREVREDP